MTAMDDALLARAIRERREAIEERDRLRAALTEAHKALGSFLWLGNNLHNSGTETFRDLYRASLEDARTAYESAAPTKPALATGDPSWCGVHGAPMNGDRCTLGPASAGACGVEPAP